MERWRKGVSLRWAAVPSAAIVGGLVVLVALLAAARIIGGESLPRLLHIALLVGAYLLARRIADPERRERGFLGSPPGNTAACALVTAALGIDGLRQGHRTLGLVYLGVTVALLVAALLIWSGREQEALEQEAPRSGGAA